MVATKYPRITYFKKYVVADGLIRYYYRTSGSPRPQVNESAIILFENWLLDKHADVYFVYKCTSYCEERFNMDAFLFDWATIKEADSDLWDRLDNIILEYFRYRLKQDQE